jgi:PAS domain S-box-containing protein
MFKSIKIGTKITTLVIVVALVTIATVSYLAFNFSQKALEERNLQNLVIINQKKAERVADYFKQMAANHNLLVESILLKKALEKFEEESEMDFDMAIEELDDDIVNFVATVNNNFGYQSSIITNLDGQVIFSNDRKVRVGSFYSPADGNVLTEGLNGQYISQIQKIEDVFSIQISGPAYDDSGNKVGVLILQSPMEPVFLIAQDSVGLGLTGETYIGRIFNNKAVYISPLKYENDVVLRKGHYIGERNGVPLQNAAQGETGAAFDEDYRGEIALHTWDKIPYVDWGIVTKIDQAEIYGDSQKLFYRFVITGLIVVFFALILSLIFSRILFSPLISLKSTLQLLGKGILPDKVAKKSNDELGQMAETLGNLVDALKRTANFAREIGEGDFDADFKPLSENDTLGNSLLSMRENIQEAEKRDKERNWIVSGVAEVGEILRSHSDLGPLGDDVISYVTNKIGAIQGAFYVVNDDNPDNKLIEITSSYAYGKKKFLKGSYRFAEGLIGQSAIEQDTILRTEIPRDYVTITSGLLGDQRPECILIVPLITNEQVFGVMEFAGFNKFNPSQVKFVQEISLITARTVFNIKVNERTRKLLAESQAMSIELQEKQEVLRQNAEEMEATQEELKHTNQRLEEQIEEVNRTQKRMALLLENASEVITIYEKDGTVRYISPSVEKILGYNQNEMVGQSYLDHVTNDARHLVEEMFQKLIDSPFEQQSIQYTYLQKSGELIWVESTGSNLLSDASIQGVLINTRDITERKRAEQEERMRSQMQALSENSPDLITRINTEGTIFYINPIIENYTGHGPEHFLRKQISETEMPQNIIEQWMSVLSEVSEKRDKVNTEMDFPSEMGDRVMQVNAIPEFNEEQNLESVLVVSHDITSRKLIELEIQNKNKKITESINYAKRIQGAILPNNSIIHKVLPDSFILYKAKDVVSGDFPWFMQRGDDIYIAAVDCTGHGVPGALISLIGYFLLNDIVRSRRIDKPGDILDMLDEGVTKTLRQDQDDSKTKDGMDIALMKINKNQQLAEYAGAHRPLYYVKNGELEEVKGDRFPIGGGIYKNQTKFTNTVINYQEGDAVYFCSDGFPDQFGGPENRKYGPKRLRDLILENQNKPMVELHQVFDDSWEEWKADYKQTDDVLLIGIRF